jgi:tetratricopeptide (TPR) repeat protein
VYVPATPRVLDAVCLRALAKKPAERYGSAAELASEVHHYLADEPVAAYREPPLARAGRWARRHRTLVSGLAAAALVAVVSLATATVLLSAANRRESDARLLAQQRGEEAVREGAKAKANFQLARDAVEEYGTKVVNDPRLKENDLEELRKVLLQSAIQFHEKFVEKHSDDPALRADLGRAYLDLGKLIASTDDTKRAIDLNQQAIVLYEQLITGQPGDRSAPIQLGMALTDMGRWLDSQAQTKQAQDAYQRALEGLESERRLHGPSRLLTRQYLRACNNLAYLLYYKVGAQDGALTTYRRGIAFLAQEEPAEPPEVTDVVIQAELYTQFGETLSHTGQAREGLAWCEKGLGLLESLLTPASRPAEVLTSLGGAHNSIGRICSRLSQTEKALEEYRKTVAIDEELVRAHPSNVLYLRDLSTDSANLAMELIRHNQVREGYPILKKSLEAKEQLVARRPGVPDYEANLARGLFNLAEVTANREQRQEYIRRGMKVASELTGQHPEVAQYQTALARGHNVQALLYARVGQWQAAIAPQSEAVRLLEQLIKRTDLQEHRSTLGHYLLTLADMSVRAGQHEGAFAAYRKAVALNGSDATPHYRFGTSLMNAGRFDDAIVCLNQALALKSDLAEAQCNLGLCLLRKGRLTEARTALQRGHDLGSKQPGWRYRSADWVHNAERLIQLNGRLPAIFAGEDSPADAEEELALASMCQENKRLFMAATRFYATAFARSPRLAEERFGINRFNAACSAVLAATGQGEDAKTVPDKVCLMVRRQALAWLTVDLAMLQGPAAGTDAARQAVRQQLTRWQQDADLAPVREKQALDNLPASEREQWRQLWDDVAALLKKVEEKK